MDNAVVLFGTWVENAAQEMEKRGPEHAARWEQKYSMTQLLTPGFVLAGKGSAHDDFTMPQHADGITYDEVA